MKKVLFAVGVVVGALASIWPPGVAQAGERVYCSFTLPQDGGPISTATRATVTNCPADRLQPDGGLLQTDGGFLIGDTTLADGGVIPGDGGVAGCVDCSWGKAQSLFIQYDNPVYYSEVPSNTYSLWGEKEVAPATTSDVLVDFDINPDAYRIDLRGTAQHISILSVSTSANVCKVGTVERHIP